MTKKNNVRDVSGLSRDNAGRLVARVIVSPLAAQSLLARAEYLGTLSDDVTDVYRSGAVDAVTVLYDHCAVVLPATARIANATLLDLIAQIDAIADSDLGMERSYH